MKPKDIKTLITALTIIVAFVLYTTFAPDKEEVVEDKPIVSDNEPSDVGSEMELSEKVAIPGTDAEKITGNKLQTVKFLNANDGDTFNVELNGEKKRVRLLMIDTPEMNYNKGEPMPYAEEAKNFTETLLKEAEKIELLFDKGPQEDDYERLLAYIYVDGKMLQESLLEAGFGAIRYVNKPNNSLEKELREVQKEAEQAKLNIWSIEGYFENNRFQDVSVN